MDAIADFFEIQSVTARNSIKNKFLYLLSCIAVDSFWIRTIAFELLRICCRFVLIDTETYRISRTQKQDLLKDQRF